MSVIASFNSLQVYSSNLKIFIQFSLDNMKKTNTSCVLQVLEILLIFLEINSEIKEVSILFHSLVLHFIDIYWSISPIYSKTHRKLNCMETFSRVLDLKSIISKIRFNTKVLLGLIWFLDFYLTDIFKSYHLPWNFSG